MGMYIWVEPVSTSKPLAPPQSHIKAKLAVKGYHMGPTLNYSVDVFNTGRVLHVLTLLQWDHCHRRDTRERERESDVTPAH